MASTPLPATHNTDQVVKAGEARTLQHHLATGRKRGGLVRNVDLQQCRLIDHFAMQLVAEEPQPPSSHLDRRGGKPTVLKTNSRETLGRFRDELALELKHFVRIVRGPRLLDLLPDLSFPLHLVGADHGADAWGSAVEPAHGKGHATVEWPRNLRHGWPVRATRRKGPPREEHGGAHRAPLLSR